MKGYELIYYCLHKYRESKDYTGLPTHFGNGEFPNGLDALNKMYAEIPDSQKYQIVIDVYTNMRYQQRGILKYLRAIKNHAPEDMLDAISEFIDSNNNIVVYRGGLHDEKVSLKPSWTISKEKAIWFATKYNISGKDTVLYKGIIKANNIIAYTDCRSEKEIIQYRSVKNIEIEQTFKKNEQHKGYNLKKGSELQP